ncbi:hypothetical protein NL676_033424 [Syzygium grande]|nr:hypothetical protein NL676_033424 [Syzygium grande]
MNPIYWPRACLDSGFFYVINHGISQDIMEEVLVQSRRFFGLPLSEKMKLLRNKKHRGYTPMFDQILDPANQINGDYKEGYYIGILPRWRQAMEKFGSQALLIFFDKPEILSEPIATLRLLHYEGLVSDPCKGIYGAGAHSDFNFITLLATDDVPGLQICKKKDAKSPMWEFVQPMRWSTLHRVIGNGQEWYSIAYFLKPNHDCLIECLPTCMSEENPPKFPPVQCQTYLSQRFKDTHADLNVYRREGA